MVLYIDRLQRTTIFDKRHRLTVRTELRHERGPVALHKLFLHQVAGIGKLFLLGIFDLCHIYLPKTVALRGVDE